MQRTQTTAAQLRQARARATASQQRIDNELPPFPTQRVGPKYLVKADFIEVTLAIGAESKKVSKSAMGRFVRGRSGGVHDAVARKAET